MLQNRRSCEPETGVISDALRHEIDNIPTHYLLLFKFIWANMTSAHISDQSIQPLWGDEWREQ